MTREQRLRRVAILCIHFTRNLAYSRVIHSSVREKREGDFWITMQGNCLDTSVLEWCKLFGEKKGKHGWKKIIDDTDKFKLELLEHLNINEEIWESKVNELRTYRDAFVAHLDSDETMDIPKMELPFDMVKFYFSYILGYENKEKIFRGIPKDLNNYYLAHCDEAASITKT